MTESILLNVKFNSTTVCQINVDLDTSILQAKMKIADKTGIDIDNIHLILAGKILKNESIVRVMNHSKLLV